jgi:uncharacterized membrane protein
MKLERTIALVLRAGVTTSSVCLALGLIASLVAGQSALSRLLLHTGLIVLLATPVARVVVSIVEYVRARDWTFTVLTTIVLAELLASALFALVFNRRI